MKLRFFSFAFIVTLIIAVPLIADTVVEEIVARVFNRYQQLLTENSALDFDDILCKTVELLRTDEETVTARAFRKGAAIHIDLEQQLDRTDALGE